MIHYLGKEVVILKKVRTIVSGLFIGIMVFFMSMSAAFAAHPLITDDAATVGQEKLQLEVNGEYGHDEYQGVTVNAFDVGASFTYGVLNNVDIVCGIPTRHIRTSIDATPSTPKSKTTEDGLGDISLGVKWRFFKGDPFSFALKPEFSLPTGDHEKGMGTGRFTYGAYLISTGEFDPWVVHLNLGYMENKNKIDERKGVWHISVAAEFSVDERLKFVANIGSEKNANKVSSINPAFALCGFIYTIQANLDVDCGVKVGLNAPEPDLAVLAGITWNF
jgi:hypothetical protein